MVMGHSKGEVAVTLDFIGKIPVCQREWTKPEKIQGFSMSVNF